MKVVKNRLGGMIGKHASFKLDPETLNLADITFDNNFLSDSESDSSELGSILKNLPSISNDLGSL